MKDQCWISGGARPPGRRRWAKQAIYYPGLYFVNISFVLFLLPRSRHVDVRKVASTMRVEAVHRLQHSIMQNNYQSIIEIFMLFRVHFPNMPLSLPKGHYDRLDLCLTPRRLPPPCLAQGSSTKAKETSTKRKSTKVSKEKKGPSIVATFRAFFHSLFNPQ